MFTRNITSKSTISSTIFNKSNQNRLFWNKIKERFSIENSLAERKSSLVQDPIKKSVEKVGDWTERGNGLTYFRGSPFGGQTTIEQPNYLEERRTNYIDYTNDEYKNEPIPPNIKLDLPCLVGYDNPSEVTEFDHEVGTRRAERMNPNVWDELLPWVVDTSDGTGSSMLNPIIVPSLGLEERVVSCPGNCHDLRDDSDVDGHWDFWEWYYWPLQENTFAMCDQCGLVFYCASSEVMAQMEYWAQLQQDEKDELADEVIDSAQQANIDVKLLENLRSFDLEELDGKTVEEREQIALGPLKDVLDNITEDLINVQEREGYTGAETDAQISEKVPKSGGVNLSIEEALEILKNEEQKYQKEFLSLGLYSEENNERELVYETVDRNVKSIEGQEKQ